MYAKFIPNTKIKFDEITIQKKDGKIRIEYIKDGVPMMYHDNCPAYSFDEGAVLTIGGFEFYMTIEN